MSTSLPPRPARIPTTRPRTYEVTIKSILTFPWRLCNPPPAVGKVRSCGVTPLFKVKLEDVLDRNHLPPLGLKDFEEWLLYVETSPENLYFTLWLREYRERYSAWMAQNKIHRELDGEFRMSWGTHHSPSLALFYARAKQTFFMPNSPYELNLPSSLLAIFHTSMESPHPDPVIFTDVAIETYRMLDESLRRFVSAQFNNVGNNRVLCGIIAGVVFALVGSVPPLALNFAKHQSRWLRLLAFPGLFLGLTVFLSAINGICLGVYIFGDLRQLRKFELARPPISRPVPITTDEEKPTSESIPVPAAEMEEKSQPIPEGRITAHAFRAPTPTSDDHSLYTEDDISTGEHGPTQIHISPAYYDNVSVEGGMAVVPADYTFPALQPTATAGTDRDGTNDTSDFTMTAAFIHPFDTTSLDNEYDRPDFLPSERQRIDAFDFDSLPPLQKSKSFLRARRPSSTVKYDSPNCCRSSMDVTITPKPSDLPPVLPPIERQSSRCDIKKWRLQTESTDQILFTSPSGTPVPTSPHASAKHRFSITDNPYNSHILPHANRDRCHTLKSRRSLGTEFSDTETKVQKRSRLMAAVPAFAVPLTKVLSPVIRRGQWEIVVRSGAIAFVLSWVIVGIFLAIPVRK
ncbi:hypothetical protein CC1G_09824 [Coprinopsis cinerea okayama7|uniref:RGS domain-containing protein n=1 Tax=Coprinopsis cinerea (strain Okayama-7 / 130 / ATCC MYA-4618 / FGSC 9003) TaxID=240176 RepID=A8P0A0_COPC7|nr:hypothetical protein CC1G_09824 [Coprinopsis cinerea okayama7\|eukprot:XP_001837842.1 hypothetical protein CC1G_09824 [Coprinopsis cinerea okayama7\